MPKSRYGGGMYLVVFVKKNRYGGGMYLVVFVR
jgi:hypothetical protein